MALDVPVIDAHVHLWDPRTTPRRVSLPGKLVGWNQWALTKLLPPLFPRAVRDFVGDPKYFLAPYLLGDHAADCESVDVPGLIHVEAGWEGKGELAAAGETRWLDQLGGNILGIVGRADLDDPELDRLLDAHRRASKRFVGIRDKTARDADRGVMDYNPPGRMRSPAFRAGLRKVAEAGLTFDAWCYGPQLGELAQALAAVPEARVVLCHLGSPIGIGGPYAGYGATADARASILARWKDDLSRLAELPNVHAKISGLAMPVLGFGFHRRDEPPSTSELVERWGPLVEHALGVFGRQRCFFASNFPVDKVAAPWGTIFDAFAELVANEPDDVRRALFHDNALSFYGL